MQIYGYYEEGYWDSRISPQKKKKKGHNRNASKRVKKVEDKVESDRKEGTVRWGPRLKNSKPYVPIHV